jgi:hypothetical protein
MPLGLPIGLLLLLLCSVQACAQKRLVDPALTVPQALRLFRTDYALSQAVLGAIAPAKEMKKPAPNPFARPNAPASRGQPGDREQAGVAGIPVPDLASVLQPVVAEALRHATSGNPAISGRPASALRDAA